MRHVDKIRLRRLKDRVSVDNSREMDKGYRCMCIFIYVGEQAEMNFVEKYLVRTVTGN